MDRFLLDRVHQLVLSEFLIFRFITVYLAFQMLSYGFVIYICILGVTYGQGIVTKDALIKSKFDNDNMIIFQELTFLRH